MKNSLFKKFIMWKLGEVYDDVRICSRLPYLESTRRKGYGFYKINERSEVVGVK